MDINFFKNQRILITHPFLYGINGATNVTLELASFLQNSGAKVTVYTNVFEDPVKSFFDKQNIHVDIAPNKPKYHFKDFDYIWINSQTFPISLLEELGQKSNITEYFPKIIFMHMSAHEYCPDEMPYIYHFEENLSSLSLFVSDEALNFNKKYFEKMPQHDFYRNPAPTQYNSIPPRSHQLKKLLVVANEPCSELLKLQDIMKNQNIHIDYLGFYGKRYTMINEKILSEYDAIITIGKTVQYCLVSGIPVYIYGGFGGPGWLSKNNFSTAQFYNFSGRGFKTKTPEKIASEIISGYEKALLYQEKNKSLFQQKYLINNILPAIFKKAAKCNKKNTPLTPANIAAHKSLLQLVEIDFNKWYIAHREYILHNEYELKLKNSKQKILELETSLQQLTVANSKLSKIVNSRSVQTWLKFNRFIKKNKMPKPEIIAVLCTYNEQRNIGYCIKHLEPYIDKIVIFDDGSTDNTIKIAKKYKKVVKIISNPNKTKWDEKKNRETVLREAFKVSNKKNVWALCVDADERFEKKFLKNLRKITKRYTGAIIAINIHFKELWGNPYQYRIDGIWQQKKKDVLFPLSDNMTFDYPQDHHFPWHYKELNSRETLLEYNLYHLKMIKEKDRKDRVDLYNHLDPEKKMQSIGYDYLNSKAGIKLQQINPKHKYNYKSIPQYYKES